MGPRLSPGLSYKCRWDVAKLSMNRHLADICKSSNTGGTFLNRHRRSAHVQQAAEQQETQPEEEEEEVNKNEDDTGADEFASDDKVSRMVS